MLETAVRPTGVCALSAWAPFSAVIDLPLFAATPLQPSELDLDAALTAEAKTIALVADGISLVSQAGPRVAEA